MNNKFGISGCDGHGIDQKKNIRTIVNKTNTIKYS